MLRDIGMQISGTTLNLPLDFTKVKMPVPITFTGVSEIIEKSQQGMLERTYRRALLLELPSMSQSQDTAPLVKPIKLTLPSNVPCPKGTHESKP